MNKRADVQQLETTTTSGADQLREIRNIAETARFIDQLDPEAPLTHNLIREIHRRVVDGLIREGDPTPGSYREQEVAIANSAHVPPSWVTVHPEITTLLDFANASKPLHAQMLQRDGLVDPDESAALRIALTTGVIKAGDLEPIVPGSPARRSRFIGSLRERSLLQQAEEGPRFYRLSLSRGPLAPRLIRRLDALGYLPRMLAND